MPDHTSLAPTIDAVIPVFNGANFIRQALDSINQQTLQPRSIIVVDDGSTDTTAVIIKQYPTTIPLQYLRQENQGLSAARNTGWRASQATYVAFLDADDVWEPGKLAAQAAVFAAADEQLQLVYCRYHHIDLDGRRVTLPSSPVIDPTLRGRVFIDLLPLNRISGSGSAVMIRRTALVAAGGFDESLRALEDWDMWLRIAELGRIDFADDDLVGIRTHSAGMQQDSERMMVGTLRFYNRWLERLPTDVAPPSTWIRRIARFAGSTWSPRRFHHLIHTELSPRARHRLTHFIVRRMKLYTVVRTLSLPFEWLLRRPWKNRRP